MYVIIAGGGRLGFSLAQKLVKKRNDVVVIERDAKRAKAIAEEFDALVIDGDATDTEVLKNAGISKADAVIAVTGEDAKNLMVCQLAKKNKVRRIVAKVNDESNLDVYVGVADVALDVTDAALSSFINSISLEAENVLLSFGGGKMELVQLAVSEESPSKGADISKISLPKGTKCIMVERSGESILDLSNVRLASGDIVYFISKPEHVKELNKKIAGS